MMREAVLMGGVHAPLSPQLTSRKDQRRNGGLAAPVKRASAALPAGTGLKRSHSDCSLALDVTLRLLQAQIQPCSCGFSLQGGYVGCTRAFVGLWRMEDLGQEVPALVVISIHCVKV